MVKTILLTGSEGEDVEIDRPTANGCVFALDLVKATLVDPEIQALSIGFAGEVKCFQGQVSQISGTILDVIPGDTAWIIEAERWPVGENMFEARLQTELEKPEGQLLTLSHNQIIELRGRFGGC